MNKSRYFLMLVGLAAASCGGEGSTPPPSGALSGVLHGKEFTVAGQRATRSSEVLTVTLLNEAAACPGENTPKDGQLRVDISIPGGAQSAGTYDFKSAGIQLGATVITMSDGKPSFASAVVTDGQLWLETVDDTIRGAVKVQSGATQVQGEFQAALCAGSP